MAAFLASLNDHLGEGEIRLVVMCFYSPMLLIAVPSDRLRWLRR